MSIALQTRKDEIVGEKTEPLESLRVNISDAAQSPKGTPEPKKLSNRKI
jgi:hypothetical protein